MFYALFLDHLQRKITEANNIIQDTGRELVQSAEDLHHARQVQKNIVATLETLNGCIPGTARTRLTDVRNFQQLKTAEHSVKDTPET